jgi:hypothetical protein
MSREYASPDLANLIAARLAPDEFERRVQAPLTDDEAQEIAELIAWFSRRYATAQERLAYARRKLRQYNRAEPSVTVEADYLGTARRLARAHAEADPKTVLVLLDPDPRGKEIRLLEVTRSAPTTGQLLAVGFAARPDLGVAFPSSVLLLSPEEWIDINEGRLELPDGWCRSRLQAL